MPRRRDEPEPTALAFGRAVRRVREQQGLSLDGLGERMGRQDGRYIGEVERGYHAPTIVTAKEIADALETQLADLVKGL